MSAAIVPLWLFWIGLKGILTRDAAKTEFVKETVEGWLVAIARAMARLGSPGAWWHHSL